MEEAPSVAAMIVCAGYASVQIRGMMRRSSKSLMSESNLIGKVALPSIIAVKIVLLLRPAVDGPVAPYCFENYPPSTKQQPSQRAYR